jgi:hypothetical protein
VELGLALSRCLWIEWTTAYIAPFPSSVWKSMVEGWQFLTKGVDYTVHILPPSLDRYEMAVNDAIAACGGDTQGR